VQEDPNHLEVPHHLAAPDGRDLGISVLTTAAPQMVFPAGLIRSYHYVRCTEHPVVEWRMEHDSAAVQLKYAVAVRSIDVVEVLLTPEVATEPAMPQYWAARHLAISWNSQLVEGNQLLWEHCTVVEVAVLASVSVSVLLYADFAPMSHYEPSLVAREMAK
jgi:hypothetical protein